jgi:hypothetical protein
MATYNPAKFEGTSRYEREGKRREYCEVEVVRTAKAWVTRFRHGIVGVEAPLKRQQKTTNNGFGARDDADSFIERLIEQGYHQVRLPRGHLAKRAAPKRVPLVERGVPLVSAHVERAGVDGKRRPPGGDPARLAKVRLSGRQRLPPTVFSYLTFDLKMARLPHRGPRPLLLDPRTYEPIALDPAAEAERLVRAHFARPLGAMRLVDFDSGRVLGSFGAAIDTRLKGKLYRLPSIGEQNHYLYAGRADAAGELPIVSFELELDRRSKDELAVRIAVFLKYPSFDQLLADLDDQLEERLRNAAERRAFLALMRDVRKRHPELLDQATY